MLSAIGADREFVLRHIDDRGAYQRKEMCGAKSRPNYAGRAWKFDRFGQCMPDRAQTHESQGVIWWAHEDSNLEPKDYESSALTIEL